MKFFSELGSCFRGGAATVTPAADISSTNSSANCSGGGTGSSRAGGAGGLRKMTSVNKSRNWMPKLNVICEDGVMVSHDSSLVVRSDDKLSVNGKTKSKPKVPRSTHGDDYWKSSGLWAVPAFSPTPFSF